MAMREVAAWLMMAAARELASAMRVLRNLMASLSRSDLRKAVRILEPASPSSARASSKRMRASEAAMSEWKLSESICEERLVDHFPLMRRRSMSSRTSFLKKSRRKALRKLRGWM